MKTSCRRADCKSEADSSVPTLMEQVQLVSIGGEIFLGLVIIKQAIDRGFLEEGEAQDL